MTKNAKKLTEQQSKNRPSVLQSDQHFPIRTDKHTKKNSTQTNLYICIITTLEKYRQNRQFNRNKKNPDKTTNTRPILGLYTTVPPPTLCA